MIVVRKNELKESKISPEMREKIKAALREKIETRKKEKVAMAIKEKIEEKKASKLQEADVLVNPNPQGAAPVQAAPSEIAQATTPVDTSTPADPFTPPAPGMVPTGWNYPDNLAAAIAQETGDVEAAQTAADAMVTDQPIAEPNPAPAESQTEPMPVMESIDLKESEDGDDDEEIEDEDTGKIEEPEDHCDEEECEEHEEHDNEIDDDVVDAALNSEETEDTDLGDPMDYLSKFEAYFDDKPQEEVADLANAFQSTADFLNYLLDSREEDDDEMIADEEDEEDEDLELPEIEDDPITMTEQINYPAGSRPEASEIANSQRAREIEENNLVRNYNENLQARRDIINKFRQELRENRSRNAANKPMTEERQSFREALRGRGTSRLHEDVESNSWENNKFLDKYLESQKLDFRKIMDEGLLG